MGSRQMEEKRPNLFKEAVERTPDIQNGYRIGYELLYSSLRNQAD